MICEKYNALMFLEIFRTNLFLATHSETNCSSLLGVAVISVTVVANVCSVEASAYIKMWLYSVSSMSLVKIENSKGPKQLHWGIPDSNCIIFERFSLKNTLCVLLDKYLFIHIIAEGVKP